MSTLALVLRALQTAAVPFSVGERLEHTAKFGLLNVGTAAIEVASVDTVHAEPAYHFRYTLEASAILFRIKSTIESWASVASLHSLRFRRDNIQNGKQYLRSFEIFGDSGYYRQVEPEPLPHDAAPPDPLDDASFLYFVRTTPLEVGKTYTFDRYYWSAKNPISITVQKRELMELPGGIKASCLVLNPVVGETGLFAKSARAQLWLTDDARRIPVQIRTTYRFGTIVLKLERSIKP